jgi:4-hydroxy-tetrahydrodipicolinate synthase
MFSGSIPALVTPFDAQGHFVEPAYRDLIEWQIAEGSSALVPCGTTGEAATLTKEEQFAIVRVCVDQARGRVPSRNPRMRTPPGNQRRAAARRSR